MSDDKLPFDEREAKKGPLKSIVGEQFMNLLL